MAVTHRAGKFAILLHADIAGSTSLVHKDEHLAHDRIQATFRRFGDTITRYHGRVRELRGDALLAEFERASDAVTAALAFQVDQTKHNEHIEDDVRPTVRVGIAMGEVVFADRTVTGAGVVLAQRMEQLAKPGGVCITAAIHESLPQRMPFDQQSLGERDVKGFDEPVRVYTVSLTEGGDLPEPSGVFRGERVLRIPRMLIPVISALVIAVSLLVWHRPWEPEFERASRDAMAFPLPDDKPSIAVLPFKNHSEKKELEYFAIGLTENITSALSKAPGLFVIARNSVTGYKEHPVDVRQVSEDLGVQYVLKGSVQQGGDSLRITTQLVDALRGRHVWADRFDRQLSDAFVTQDEITKHVITELQVELTDGEFARLAGRGTDNVDAWLLRTEAYEEFLKFTRESQIRARQLYRAAHEADPAWAFPVAGISNTHWYEARLGWSESRDESIRMATITAQKAIELQPDEAIGYEALANVKFLVGDSDEGIRLFQKAISLAPSSFVSHATLAIRLTDRGLAEEAIPLYERAIRLSPRHPWWVNAGYGLALHLAGRSKEAIEVYQKGIDTGTNDARLYARLAAAYADVGHLEEARQAAADAIKNDPQFTIDSYLQTYAFIDPEKTRWYKELLRQTGLPE